MAETKEQISLLSNKVYDVLKPVVEIILPAVITFWIAVGTIWGLPNVEPIAGTLTALTALLGAFLLLSNKQYKKLPEPTDGDLLVDITEEGQQYMTVALEKPLEDLSDRDAVTFAVVRSDASR